MKNLFFLFLFIISANLVFAQETKLARPDYELKFYLRNEKVLNQDRLKDEISSQFGIFENIDMGMEFLDSNLLNLVC